MAAQPKKKISKVRGKTRRTHYTVHLPEVVIDKATGTPRLPHRLAPDTGMYNGRIALKTRTSKRLDKAMARSARASKQAAKAARKEKPVSKPDTTKTAKPKSVAPKKTIKKSESKDKE
jgi:large subunit ribosomal protein L32